MEIANAQMETRKQSVFLTPLKSLDETLAQEYQKGEIAGIHLFMNLAEVRINELRTTISLLTKELEYESSDETNVSEFDGDTASP